VADWLSLELHERGRSRLHYVRVYITLSPTFTYAYICLHKEHPVAVCDISFMAIVYTIGVLTKLCELSSNQI